MLYQQQSNFDWIFFSLWDSQNTCWDAAHGKWVPGGKTSMDNGFTLVTMSTATLPHTTHSHSFTLPESPNWVMWAGDETSSWAITFALGHQSPNIFKNLPHAENVTQIWSTGIIYHIVIFFQNNCYFILISSINMSRAIICTHSNGHPLDNLYPFWN